jgi:hypothetical protein
MLIMMGHLAPATIELIGSSFNLDPHVFYFHLGFDTRRSAMVDLIPIVRDRFLLSGVSLVTPQIISSAYLYLAI